MEHPNIRTLHFDDVPRSLAREITTHADLTFFFGPLGEGFLQKDLGWVAVQKLGMHLPDLHRLSGHPEDIEAAILDLAAKQGEHVLLVLQIHPTPLEGYVCLVPRDHLQEVERILSRVPNRLRQ